MSTITLLCRTCGCLDDIDELAIADDHRCTWCGGTEVYDERLSRPLTEAEQQKAAEVSRRVAATVFTPGYLMRKQAGGES